MPQSLGVGHDCPAGGRGHWLGTTARRTLAQWVRPPCTASCRRLTCADCACPTVFVRSTTQAARSRAASPPYTAVVHGSALATSASSLLSNAQEHSCRLSGQSLAVPSQGIGGLPHAIRTQSHAVRTQSHAVRFAKATRGSRRTPFASRRLLWALSARISRAGDEMQGDTEREC